jgi:hypothetical protein
MIAPSSGNTVILALMRPMAQRLAFKKEEPALPRHGFFREGEGIFLCFIALLGNASEYGFIVSSSD